MVFFNFYFLFLLNPSVWSSLVFFISIFLVFLFSFLFISFACCSVSAVDRCRAFSIRFKRFSSRSFSICFSRFLTFAFSLACFFFNIFACSFSYSSLRISINWRTFSAHNRHSFLFKHFPAWFCKSSSRGLFFKSKY